MLIFPCVVNSIRSSGNCITCNTWLSHNPSSAVMRENSSFDTSAAMFAGADRNINKVTITVRIIVNVVSLLKVLFM